MLSHNHLADKMGAEADPTVVPRIQKEKVWSLRDNQEPYTYNPVAERGDLENLELFVGRKANSKSFSEVSDYGTGTTLLVENKNLAHNMVQDINGVDGGSLTGIKIKSNTSILTQADLIDNKAMIIKSFKKKMTDIYEQKLEGKELKDAVIELNRAESSMIAANTIDELHEAVAGSLTSRHPEMFLNSTIKEAGFDGYAVKVSDPTNTEFSNGVLMLKLRMGKSTLQCWRTHSMILTWLSLMGFYQSLMKIDLL